MGVQSAAFYALDKSDILNSLTSRITGGSINRYTLAQSVIQQATELALEIPYCRNEIQRIADLQFGLGQVDGVNFARSIINVLRETNEAEINESLSQVLGPILEQMGATQAIPWTMIAPTITLSQGVFASHIGARPVERFLATYIKTFGWNIANQHIQTAAQEQNSIVRAGIGWVASFVQGLIHRGVVEDPQFQDGHYPEHALVVGCLHAYLSNQADCRAAIDAYTPSTALLNGQSIRDVAALASDFATHRTVLAAEALEVSAQNLVLAGEMVKAAEEAVKSAENGSEAQVDAQSNLRFTGNALVSQAGEEALAKAAYQSACTARDIVFAASDLLVDKPERDADERIKGAIRTLLNVVLKSQGVSIDESGYVATGVRYVIDTAVVPALANNLQADNHLPVQNIIGTYAALHDNDLSALQYYLSAQLNSALASRAVRNGVPVSWFEDTASRAAVKLAVSHLDLYIRNGDFHQPESPEYRLIADVINTTVTNNESYTTAAESYLHNVAQRESGNYIALQNVGATVAVAAMGLGGAAYSVANSVAEAGRDYRRDLVTQLNEVGVTETLKNATMRVGTAIPSYVSRVTSHIATNLTTSIVNLMPVSIC